MTIKELEQEIKRLRQEIKEQNNKWNKILTAASVVSAITSVLNLVLIIYNKKN